MVLNWGRGGNCPQNSALPPKCDIKHCLMNWKHRHIGAKRERFVTFEIWQNAFPAGAPPPGLAGELTTLPKTLVGWGGDTRSHPTCLKIFVTRKASVAYFFSHSVNLNYGKRWMNSEPNTVPTDWGYSRATAIFALLYRVRNITSHVDYSSISSKSLFDMSTDCFDALLQPFMK